MHQPPTTPAKTGTLLLWSIVKWTLFISLVLLLVSYIAANLVLAPYIQHQLESAVHKGSKGMYALKMENLKIHFWRGKVVAEGVVLAQDSALYARLLKKGEDVGRSRISFKSPVITISNIRWREYLTDSLIRVGEVYVDFPEAIIHRDTRRPKRLKPIQQRRSVADTVQPPVFERLPELIGNLSKALYIDTLLINQGIFKYKSISKEGTAYHTADSISIAFRDIRIDSSSQTEAWHRVLYASDVQFGLRNYRYQAADGIYGLKIRRIKSPNPLTLLIDSLDLRTLISDEEFARRKKYAKDRFAIFIPHIHCHELDIERFFRNDYVAEAIHLYDPIFNLYRDKRNPRDPSPRKMPNEAIQQLPFYFKVDTLHFHEAKLRYAELVPGATQSGDIVLEKTGLLLLNLTNDPEYMSTKTPAIIYGETLLMGKGKLELTLTINLLDKQFNCQYSGQMNEMELAYFNRFFLPNENINVQDGQIEKVLFAVNVQNGLADGHLKAVYHNLKLSIIDPDKKKEKKVLSLLGNLMLKSNNEPSEKKPVKIGKVLYPRLEDDGFIRFLWRSLKTGLLSTLVPERLANAANKKKSRESGNPKPQYEEKGKKKDKKDKKPKDSFKNPL